MRKECANEDLHALISLVVTFSVSTKRKELPFFFKFFGYCVLKRGRGPIKLLTEVSKTKTRKYNVLNSADPNHLSCYDSS